MARCGPRERPYWDPVDQIVVRAGPPLEGVVAVRGAKNSALKLMAATLLAEGEYRLSNVPLITDVDTMAELLVHLGLEVSRPKHP